MLLAGAVLPEGESSRAMLASARVSCLQSVSCVMQVRTAVSKTLVRLFENDVLGALLEDAPAQTHAYNRSVAQT